MNNQNSTSTSSWSTIFAAIAAIGTIFAAITPIVVTLTSKSSLSSIFVSPKFTVLLSIISLIAVSLASSYCASNLGYHAVDYNAKPKIVRNLLFIWLVSIVLFLIARLMYDAHALSMTMALVFQSIFYIGSFVALGSGLGLFLRDIHDSQKFQYARKQKMNTVRNLLLESGHLTVDCKIKSITQDWGQNINGYAGAYIVLYESNQKDWVVAFDSEITQIIDFKEVPKD